jgi:hypothetical protein
MNDEKRLTQSMMNGVTGTFIISRNADIDGLEIGDTIEMGYIDELRRYVTYITAWGDCSSPIRFKQASDE